MSPHRYAGVYDELLSPPRRSVEPPYGPRYGPRNNAPPPSFPQLGVKPIPPLVPVQAEPPPGYRGRYDAPPFEDVPPGVEPPVPGFEPSPFEKPSFGPPGPIERDRIPPPNYRDPYRPPPYVDGPAGYRDMPIPPVQNEIPVHVGDHPSRYRDNYRPGHPYRDQGPVMYRDGQPYRESGPQAPYRDGNFRGPPPPFRDNSYRNAPYRDGNFRDNVPHNFREPGAPFRPPSADPREPIPPNYHDPNYRDGYRDENNAGRDHMRPGFRSNIRNRGGSRRNPNIEHDRHREREGRERERFNENRDPPDRVERPRDIEKRPGYEKRMEVRDERAREHEKNRDYDKERERGHDKGTPDKKVRTSPKRNRDTREKKRSESRGRSRDRDRESRREKKEDRIRDRTSTERSRDHKDKDKDKKIKDKKKKKREKEKDNEKKRKRDKKEKKDKDYPKKDDEGSEKGDTKGDIKDIETDVPKEHHFIKPNNVENEQPVLKKEEAKFEPAVEKTKDDLYGDEAAEAVDKEIIQNYVKTENKEESTQGKAVETSNKEEPFDGIELQAPTEELEGDIETTGHCKEMLAPLPELSKWEVDEDNIEKTKEPGEITSPEEEEDSGKVTSEVIKRAENAIFAKAINSLRPIEIKKISSDRLKLYGDESQQKSSMNNIQITVPVADSEQRSIELNDRKRRYSKTPPPRLSVKDRLGGKVEDVRRTREMRVVQSTVERVKSRSKTPKREQTYRRVTVDKERGRKPDPLNRMETSKSERRLAVEDVRFEDSSRVKREFERNSKNEKKTNIDEKLDLRSRGQDRNPSSEVKATSIERERKKSILDEAHFEPDYDETVESDTEAKEDGNKKRERSISPAGPSDSKKVKLDETIKLDLTNVKKKPDSDSESSSDSDATSSSSSSGVRRRKKKKKRTKKKKKRAASDSDSDSDSSSDDHKKKKKKRKHKKKSSKKKKKSKHK